MSTRTERTAPGPAGAPTGSVSAEISEPAMAQRRASHHRKRVGLATWFLILAAPVGLLLVFLTPPSQGLDEQNHFYRVYGISTGELVPVREAARAGGLVPDCVDRYIERVYDQAKRNAPMAPHAFFGEPAGCAHDRSRFIPFDNTAIFSPVAYLPHLVGVTATRAVGLPIPVVFYAGRLCSLFAYLVLVYLALRIARRGAAVLFVLGAMPMSLLLATVYSADPMTIGLGLLTISIVLRLMFDRGDAPRQLLVGLFVALTALALCKHLYAIFSLLVFLVPDQCLVDRRRARVVKLAAVVWIVVLATGWWSLVRDVDLAGYHPPGTIDPGQQIRYAIEHPISFLGILIRGLFGRAAQGHIVPTVVGSVGMSRNFGSPLAPPMVAVFAYLVVLAAYRREFAQLVRLNRPSNVLALVIPLVIAVGIVVGVEVILWVAWTEVGSTAIEPMHGRYLIPLAALPMLSLHQVVQTRDPQGHPWALVVGSGVLLLWCVLFVQFQFY